MGGKKGEHGFCYVKSTPNFEHPGIGLNKRVKMEAQKQVIFWHRIAGFFWSATRIANHFAGKLTFL